MWFRSKGRNLTKWFDKVNLHFQVYVTINLLFSFIVSLKSKIPIRKSQINPSDTKQVKIKLRNSLQKVWIGRVKATTFALANQKWWAAQKLLGTNKKNTLQCEFGLRKKTWKNICEIRKKFLVLHSQIRNDKQRRSYLEIGFNIREDVFRVFEKKLEKTFVGIRNFNYFCTRKSADRWQNLEKPMQRKE